MMKVMLMALSTTFANGRLVQVLLCQQKQTNNSKLLTRTVERRVFRKKANALVQMTTMLLELTQQLNVKTRWRKGNLRLRKERYLKHLCQQHLLHLLRPASPQARDGYRL